MAGDLFINQIINIVEQSYRMNKIYKAYRWNCPTLRDTHILLRKQSFDSIPETTPVLQQNDTVLTDDGARGWITAAVMTSIVVPCFVVLTIIIIKVHRRRVSRSHRSTEQDGINSEYFDIYLHWNVTINSSLFLCSHVLIQF